jgi:nuclear transport factor 2 (NTF2) superfamily protein
MKNIKLILTVTFALLLVSLNASAKEVIDVDNIASYRIFNKASYLHYIKVFNEKNRDAFEAYFSEDVYYRNGNLVLEGIDAVKAHYKNLWEYMEEDLTVNEFVFDGDTLAVDLHAHFTAIKTDESSPFGPIKTGDNFDYYGSIIYKINHRGKISRVIVSYLDFTITKDGVTTSIGIPH